jgi:acyl carrier protein
MINFNQYFKEIVRPIIGGDMIKDVILVNNAKIKNITITEEIELQKNSVGIDLIEDWTFDFIDLIQKIEKDYGITIKDDEYCCDNNGYFTVKTFDELNDIIKNKTL